MTRHCLLIPFFSLGLVFAQDAPPAPKATDFKGVTLKKRAPVSNEVLKVKFPKPVESNDLSFTAPDIAENGAVVPIAFSTALPGVKRVAFLVEKNPTTLAGVFDFTDAVETSVATRIKMGQTSNVLAVAIMGDGKVLYAQKEVKVTLGGCGG